MSLLPQDAKEETAAFFIDSDSEHNSERDDHHQVILQKANALASENCLKEAIDCVSLAMRYGPVRPDELSVVVDCIFRNFKSKLAGPDAGPGQSGDTCGDSIFDCPNCRGFLAEPVTLACGHSYCKRCLHRRLLSKCKLCDEVVKGEEKLNITLTRLLDKWFPGQTKTTKSLSELDELLSNKCYHEVVTLATNVIQADPESMVVARLSRSEAYTALQQYQEALEDAEFCSRPEMLQRSSAEILCNLLFPDEEKVKEGLKETAHNSSPHLRNKAFMADQPSPAQKQHQVRATSAHIHSEGQERRWESLERHSLSRAHSLQIHGSSCGEEGLKRVCSAPQLGNQEKGSLLKRKLSVSDTEPSVVDRVSSKHKKQGAAKSSIQQLVKEKTCRKVSKDVLDPNDFECALCMRLFYEPVTTPCGHTFCKTCLERCLDHTPHCPLCKESLKQYLACRKYMVTTVLDLLIKHYLSQEYAERTKTHLDETRELSDLTKNVPIFVCTMAYPTVPCPLHVFEPRYRLMIRRCMETGTRQFGMCINDPQKGFVDYGCMLIIRSVHFLPDGRSVVDTVGGKRFRVLTRGMKDGYSTADIEHLEDTRVEDSEEQKRLQELYNAVYDQARVWFQNLKVRFHNQILQHFGPMPEREADIQATPNGPACCWWLLAVLPIDPRYQLSVLSMSSLKERLVKIQQILTYLQSIPSI
ncbi:LON peptidase N-terminal domain and ring finger 1, like isoform X2 [Takifugu flavidus]|uniref:LON peptidase N-terminal domain and ring finger 1, like isoform X2 n=1 Tax=Takifugu flavidus TaxID=433684 RepID=UPI0025444407|nr:LON peptidase N-terminal domain and ring finger 1, like isoform X2 [Takifugu flavidus]